MMNSDARRFAKRQLELDRSRTRAFPDLLVRKVSRMAASPFAFLRGAAPLFYELVPELGVTALPGEGWIVGDAHLENFGAFTVAPLGADGALLHKEVEFDVNDFDETVRGPWSLDVVRLATSVILAARALGLDGIRSLALAETLIESHASAISGTDHPSTPPAPIAAHIERVSQRSKKELLDARTKSKNGVRHFVRGDRYRDLPLGLARAVPAAFAAYAEHLVPRPKDPEFEVVDAAQRIAGTGSLGALRIAVLTRGKGNPDGNWVFDLKEESATTAYAAGDSEGLEPAERVAKGCRACLRDPPRMVGATKLGDRSLFVRRLGPQEDKLELGWLSPNDFATVVGYLGALLGRAHRRGATSRDAKAWSASEQAELLRCSVALAGMHEAIHLEFCLLARELS